MRKPYGAAAQADKGPDFDTELAKFSPRQMEAVRLLDSGKIKFLLYGGALGGGKAQSVNQEVYTPFGIQKIGNLVEGDTILNPDGKPQTVIAIHNQGIKPIYRVRFNDGAETDCCLDHLWLVNKTQRHRSKRDQSFDPFIGNKFFGGEIWTTEKIKGWLKQHPAPRTQNLLIPLCEPLQFTKGYRPRNNPRKINPYLLGVLLGDGCLKNLTPFFTSNDPEIANRLESFGVKVRKRKSASAWGIVSSPEVRLFLEKCGLMNAGAESKFIPESYKWAPLNDRKLLVQGLMDTDGYVDKRGHCSFTSVSKTLAYNFQWVIRSLGGKATITPKRPFYRDKNGEKVSGSIAFTVYFRTKIDPDLVWLDRKRQFTSYGFNGGLGELSRSIVSVEHVGNDEAVCITVSNPNGLYVTRDFIVTHNSYFLRWWCIRRLNILARAWGIKQPVGMLACEDYPSLKDRQLAKISREVPRWIGSMVQDHKDYGRCLILHPQWGGGVLCFRNLDDPSKYASAEFAFIAVDELTKNTYEVFDHLRTRLRWEGLPDIECQFASGTNPGSIGHGWVKQFWMDKLFPPEWTKPIDYRSSFAYVPSLADDNPHLDASYWAMLETLPPTLRKAFRDGNWDVFIGQAFPDFSKDLHGIEPMPIPRGASIYLTHDYGFAKPFSFGWWWVDGDGRVYRFHEWYGWNGQPDTGMRLADSAVAEQLIDIEKRILPSWCKPEMVHRIAGPDLFAKQPDKKGGGQGPPTSETYAEIGRKLNHQLIFRVGDPTRHLKIRQFHERLRVLDDGRPMMYVYRTCEQFFRTVASLIMDEHKVEDIDTKGEDHCLALDTMIVTPIGQMTMLEAYVREEKIMSVDGSWHSFRDFRNTRSEAKVDIVEITFNDGSFVKCTPDHEFLLLDGSWEKAIDLYDETCYVSIQFNKWRERPCGFNLSVEQSKSLQENDTISAVDILGTRGNCCTERFGSFITEKFQKVQRFITKIIMSAITTSETSNSSSTAIIDRIIQISAITLTGLQPCTTAPQSGMEAKLVLNGTKNNIGRTVSGFLRKKLIGSARTVEVISRENATQNSVLASVETTGASPTKSGQKKENVNFASNFLKLYGQAKAYFVRDLVLQNSDGIGLRVVRVRPLGKEQVFCITVDRLHCFTLANGVVASNCFDEACHIMMARPLKLPEERAKLSQYDKRLNRLEQGNKGSYTEMATMEQDNELRRLESGRDSWEQDPESDDLGGDDGGMVPTV